MVPVLRGLFAFLAITPQASLDVLKLWMPGVEWNLLRFLLPCLCPTHCYLHLSYLGSSAPRFA